MFYKDGLFKRNKKYIYFNMYSLAWFISLLFQSINFIYVSIFIIIWLNKKLMLIDKVIKHN
jgi:hypothetical protein